MPRKNRENVTYAISAFSPYRWQIENRTYIFSQEIYLDKFKAMITDAVEDMAYKMTKRHNIHIRYDVLAEVLTYLEVEKYGIRIEVVNNQEREVIVCRDEIMVDGKTLRRIRN